MPWTICITPISSTCGLEERTLAAFSYINPGCYTIDSVHPTGPMASGEQMIKHLYDALRRLNYRDNA